MNAKRILKIAALSVAITFAAVSMAALSPATEVSASGKPKGGICFQPHQSPGKSASGAWGSAQSDGKGVSYSINPGYKVTICAKAGRGNNTVTVSDSGYVSTPFKKKLSHWAYKVKVVPAQTETTTDPEPEQEFVPQVSSTSTGEPQVLPATLPKAGAGSVLTLFAGVSSLGYLAHRLFARFK